MCLHKRNSFVHFAFTLYLIQGGFNMGRVAPDITRSYTQNHQILDNNHNGFVNKSQIVIHQLNKAILWQQTTVN